MKLDNITKISELEQKQAKISLKHRRTLNDMKARFIAFDKQSVINFLIARKLKLTLELDDKLDFKEGSTNIEVHFSKPEDIFSGASVRYEIVNRDSRTNERFSIFGSIKNIDDDAVSRTHKPARKAEEGEDPRVVELEERIKTIEGYVQNLEAHKKDVYMFYKLCLNLESENIIMESKDINELLNRIYS